MNLLHTALGTGPASQRSVSPERFGANVKYAQAGMHALVSDVVDDVCARMESNLAGPKEFANKLHGVASVARPLLKLDISKLDLSPSLPDVLNLLPALSADVDVFMGDAFEPFANEHSALLEPEDIETVRSFATWVRDQVKLVPETRARFADAFRRGFEEGAEQDKADAEEWDGTAGDGLLDEASDS